MTVVLPVPPGKPRPKRMRPVKPTRRARMQYLEELKRQTDLLRAQTANLSDLIKSGAGRAQVAARLSELAAESITRIEQLAPGVARSFVTQVDREQKKATEAAIARAMGVEFAAILDTPNTAADLDLAIGRNTSLIKSITDDHWNLVGQAVLDNYRGAPLPEGQSLTERLRQLGGISERRAALIARDQTSKLTGALNQSRQESNGIEEYVWRTVGDRRVVGTPGGLYPKGSRAHEDHYSRDGKTFRWDAPPKDGHPGEAINCRCIAVPILDPAKLEARYA